MTDIITMNNNQRSRYKKGLVQKFFLLEKSFTDHISLSLSGTTLNVYNVKIYVNSSFPKIYCNCPDSKSWAKSFGCICKHSCFVLKKVFKNIDLERYLTNYIFLPEEIESMKEEFNNLTFHVEPGTENISIYDLEYLKIYNGKKKVKPEDNPFKCPKLEEEKECSICYDNLENTNLKCPDCNQIFHKQCIEFWLNSGRSTCPYCRSDTWAILKSNKNAYINLHTY